MTTQAMSVQDELWLNMDRPNNLMVIDGTMVLRGLPTREACAATFEHTIAKFPVFKRRPVRDGDGWAWEDAPDFTLSDHLEFIDFDEPRTIGDVQTFLAQQRSVLLDPQRPLWRGFILSPIELADGSLGSAVVCRFHHSIADGVRLTQVMLGMCEAAETSVAAKVGTRRTPVAEQHTVSLSDGMGKAVADVGSAARRAVETLIHTAKTTLRNPLQAVANAPEQALSAAMTGATAIEHSWDLVRHPDRFIDWLEVYGFEHNRGTNDLTSLTKLALTNSGDALWSGKPGVRKAVSWSEPISLAEVKRVGRESGATVNDVMIAAVAGGLRRYLLANDAVPGEVVWMVPVNLKPFEDNLPEELGNYFALVMISMNLQIKEPQARLQHMHKRMSRIKNSDEAVITFGVQRLVSSSPGQIAYALTNFFANKAVGVLTNVPGPDGPVTFADVPVHQIVGFAPCSGDQPMTATIFSYNGGVTVGFASDADLVPDPDRLAQFVVADLADLGVHIA